MNILLKSNQTCLIWFLKLIKEIISLQLDVMLTMMQKFNILDQRDSLVSILMESLLLQGLRTEKETWLIYVNWEILGETLSGLADGVINQIVGLLNLRNNLTSKMLMMGFFGWILKTSMISSQEFKFVNIMMLSHFLLSNILEHIPCLTFQLLKEECIHFVFLNLVKEWFLEIKNISIQMQECL